MCNDLEYVGHIVKREEINERKVAARPDLNAHYGARAGGKSLCAQFAARCPCLSGVPTAAVLDAQKPHELNPDNCIIQMYALPQRGMSFAPGSSGVKVTHLPSGMSESCHSERSAHRNRLVAWERLVERVQATPTSPAVATAVTYGCYQCEAYVAYLFADSQCGKCTRTVVSDEGEIQ